MREDHGSGGAVTGNIGGLAGHLPDHLHAHVFKRVPEFELAGDHDAGVDDGGRAKGTFQHDRARLRPQRHPHRLRQGVDAGQDLGVGFVVEEQLFGGHVSRPEVIATRKI